MNDPREVLKERLARVEDALATACARAKQARSEVQLIAVTKTVTPEIASLLPELGCVHLGESRPQELWKKAAATPGVNWHLIGHLQRNKIERTIPLASLVHSVDSERVLIALGEFGAKRGSPVRVLLEVNCSREEAKGGLAPGDAPAITDKALSLPGVALEGLMTMAAYSDDPESTRGTFAELRELREALRVRTGLALPELSMGMSNDYAIAVEEGSTMIRLGSVLFEGL